MARLKRLVIHSTATPEGREVTGDDIRRWHTLPKPQGRGWKQVGYTDLFHLNGSIERLVENNEDAVVDPWEITNGVAGHNSTSRHIVLVGGVRNGKAAYTYTPEQMKSLTNYVKAFHRRHPSVEICGHQNLASTACPSFDVKAWLKTIGIN